MRRKPKRASVLVLLAPRRLGAEGFFVSTTCALFLNIEDTMLHLPGLTFDHGEDIAVLREAVQQFAASEIAPLAAEWIVPINSLCICGKNG